MRDLDLVYLAHLVKRDGDEHLQSFFDTNRAKLYSELMSLADQVNQRKYGREFIVPITSTMHIDATRHGLEYEPPILKPNY